MLIEIKWKGSAKKRGRFITLVEGKTHRDTSHTETAIMGQAENEHQTDRQTNRVVMMGRRNEKQTDRQSERASRSSL